MVAAAFTSFFDFYAGIEVSPDALEGSLRDFAAFLVAELKAGRRPVANVFFCNGDICFAWHINPFTVAFAFDQGFPPELSLHNLLLVLLSHTVELYVTCKHVLKLQGRLVEAKIIYKDDNLGELLFQCSLASIFKCCDKSSARMACKIIPS